VSLQRFLLVWDSVVESLRSISGIVFLLIYSERAWSGCCCCGWTSRGEKGRKGRARWGGGWWRKGKWL